MGNIENLTALEEKLNTSRDLLEIAYSYCVSNSEKSDEISTLSSILDLILKTNHDLILELEEYFS